MSIFFLTLLIPLAIFIIWLGSVILEKAGVDRKWVFCLLIPVVNIIMIWVFAFSNWPNLKDNVEQNINQS